jgi:hypothetical protein
MPFKAWGGEKALVALLDRNRRKLELCNSRGIQLLVFEFAEPLTIDHFEVKDRIAGSGYPTR